MKSRIILFFILGMMLIPFTAYAQNLQSYLEDAANNNPGLQAKYAEFEAAVQRVDQVNTLSNPTFSFGYFININARYHNQYDGSFRPNYGGWYAR